MSSKFRILSVCLFAWTATALFSSTVFAADESKTTTADKEAGDQPIYIEADQLISDNEKKFAEFIGNVKAKQADFVMTSDQLRIYYRGELINTDGQKDTNNDKNNEDMLKKIVATGNVKIESSQYTAESNEVEYDTDSMTITMTGENSKIIISGKNSISGSKIVLYRKDGRVKVLGSKKKRVEATFYSGGNASDAFKIEK